MTQLNQSQTNRMLGYPADARLLLINADDFGMCHAINEAIFRTLKDGLVRSTTVMAPCPWALQAMQLLRENPDIAFGVHLTVICETVTKSARYSQLLRELPVGLSEWAVDPGLDTAELRTIEPDGKRVRQTDFDFLMSQEAQDMVKAEGIILLDYRPLQALWRAA
jgi:predicted glycoside hydrolase/deacetylase ChbG (UPF0249 family)